MTGLPGTSCYFISSYKNDDFKKEENKEKAEIRSNELRSNLTIQSSKNRAIKQRVKITQTLRYWKK